MHELWESLFFENVRNLMYVSKLKEKTKKIFCFLGNCIWIGCHNASVLWREYLSSAVSVLTNKPNISDITKRNIFHFGSFQRDNKRLQKCCRADFSSVWESLGCWLSKGFLKQTFQVFTFPRLSQSVISETYSLWGPYLFSKCSKIDVGF